MRKNERRIDHRTRLRIACAAIPAVICFAGCHEYVNPWNDQLLGPDAVTTASVHGARSQEAVSYEPVRVEESAFTSPQDGSVSHFPLWWQDPFEQKGSDDDQFAWTWEDYFAMPYGLSRAILNTLAVPVSAVVHPPVPRMVSDGVLSRQALGFDHDAQWNPSGATSTPPDVLELGVIPPETDAEAAPAPASVESTE